MWCKQPFTTNRPVVQAVADCEMDVSLENTNSRRHLPSITLAESRPLAVGRYCHTSFNIVAVMLSAYSPYQQNLRSTSVKHIFQLAFAYPLVHTGNSSPIS